MKSEKIKTLYDEYASKIDQIVEEYGEKEGFVIDGKYYVFIDKPRALPIDRFLFIDKVSIFCPYIFLSFIYFHRHIMHFIHFPIQTI